MFQLRLKCPHCNNLADFALTAAAEYMITGPAPSTGVRQRQVVIREMTPAQRVRGYGVAGCPLCHGPVLIDFEATVEQLRAIQAAVNSQQQRFSAKDVRVIATYPEPQKPQRDPAYPEEVREIFAEAQEDLALNRSPARELPGALLILGGGWIVI